LEFILFLFSFWFDLDFIDVEKTQIPFRAAEIYLLNYKF